MSNKVEKLFKEREKIIERMNSAMIGTALSPEEMMKFWDELGAVEDLIVAAGGVV